MFRKKIKEQYEKDFTSANAKLWAWVKTRQLCKEEWEAMRKIVGAANWPLPPANQNHNNLLGHPEKDDIATQSSLLESCKL